MAQARYRPGPAARANPTPSSGPATPLLRPDGRTPHTARPLTNAAARMPRTRRLARRSSRPTRGSKCSGRTPTSSVPRWRAARRRRASPGSSVPRRVASRPARPSRRPTGRRVLRRRRRSAYGARTAVRRKRGVEPGPQGLVHRRRLHQQGQPAGELQAVAADDVQRLPQEPAQRDLAQGRSAVAGHQALQVALHRGRSIGPGRRPARAGRPPAAAVPPRRPAGTSASCSRVASSSVPTMPKSSGPIRPSGSTNRFPGCGSAW